MMVMVWMVISYKVEVRGWNQRERMQERYGKWEGLDWETPRYIVRKELKWEKLRLRGA